MALRMAWSRRDRHVICVPGMKAVWCYGDCVLQNVHVCTYVSVRGERVLMRSVLTASNIHHTVLDLPHQILRHCPGGPLISWHQSPNEHSRPPARSVHQRRVEVNFCQLAKIAQVQKVFTKSRRVISQKS